MAYIGRDIEYGSFTKQTFTADSSTTVFALSHAVSSANNLLVSVGGVIQEPDSAYTASGTVLTFTGTPTTGDLIWVLYLGKIGAIGTTRGAIVKQTGVGDGTTTPITLSTSAVNSASIIVTLNGVVQVPDTDFVASGTTLTFTTAPSSALAILVYFLSAKARLGKPAAGSVTAATLASSGTLPAANGSALTGVLSHADLNVLRTNIALAGFNRSTDHATTVLNMPNGFIDQFEGQTGVDDPSSTNESYDVTNDYYTNQTNTVNTTDSLPDMTANNAPSGTALASTENAGSNAAWIAMSNDSANSWVTTTPNTTGFLQFGFNNGQTAKIIKKYIIEGQTGQSTRAPRDWTFKGSNDGTTFTTLDTQTNQSFSSGERKTYNDFTNTTSYVFYRLDITANNGSTSVSIQEFELYETDTYYDMTLISETSTASASPDNAHIALFNEEGETLTLDTDIMAWASRSKQTVTATNASNVLNATAHGLSNGGRVMLSTTGTTTLQEMTHFDGSTDWLNIAEGTLGATDGKSFTVCFLY